MTHIPTPRRVIVFIYTCVFNLSAMPVCETSCSGPRASIVDSVSEQCSCMSEWFAHSSVLYFSLAVVIYLSLNVSR